MFASRLFACGLRTSPFFAASLGLSSALVLSPLVRSPIRLSSSASGGVSSKDWSFASSDARVPAAAAASSPQKTRISARTARQLSAGSVVGLCAGLLLSAVSKPLVVLIGLLVAGVQTAESYGIRLIPYRALQGYVRSVDLRSAMREHVAFKISFGLMFALSAFAEF